MIHELLLQLTCLSLRCGSETGNGFHSLDHHHDGNNILFTFARSISIGKNKIQSFTRISSDPWQQISDFSRTLDPFPF